MAAKQCETGKKRGDGEGVGRKGKLTWEIHDRMKAFPSLNFHLFLLIWIPGVDKIARL